MSTETLFLLIGCICISCFSCRDRKVSEQKKHISMESTSSVLNEQNFSDTIPIEKNMTYTKSTDPADSVWIRVLNKIKLPKQIRQNSLINVYFKYNQIISGYEVTARFMPFDACSETGYVVLNFRDTLSGQSVQYINTEKYSNFNICEVKFSDEFEDYCDGDVYYFEYILPDVSDSLLLGYYTPFQFLDVDFDGENELLTSDWGQYQGGNQHDVYKMIRNKLVLQDYVPLNYLFTTDIIDTLNKTIILYWADGYYDRTSFFFSKQERKLSVSKISELNGAGQGIIEEFYRQRNHSFSLDSVHHFLNDTTYLYRMVGNELRLIKSLSGDHL